MTSYYHHRIGTCYNLEDESVRGSKNDALDNSQVGRSLRGLGAGERVKSRRRHRQGERDVHISDAAVANKSPRRRRSDFASARGH